MLIWAAARHYLLPGVFTEERWRNLLKIAEALDEDVTRHQIDNRKLTRHQAQLLVRRFCVQSSAVRGAKQSPRNRSVRL